MIIERLSAKLSTTWMGTIKLQKYLTELFADRMSLAFRVKGHAGKRFEEIFSLLKKL
jgi:hypothetical protein